MAKKILTSIFAVYFLLGIAVVFIYVKQNTQPNIIKIVQHIKNVETVAQNQGDFFDRIPSILNKSLHLAAIIVYSDTFTISGRFYEPKRISRSLVENYAPQNSQLELTKNHFGSDFIQKNIILSEINRNVSIIIKKQISIAELWNNLQHYGHQNAKPAITIYSILGFILLILVVLSFTAKASVLDKKNTLLFGKKESFISSQVKNDPIIPNKVVKKNNIIQLEEKKDTGARLLYENQLAIILKKIAKILPAKKISYFSWESEHFIPVYSRFGELFIRTDSSEIPDILTELPSPKEWHKIMRSPDSKVIIIPVRKKNTLLGAFTLDFSNNILLTDQEINRSLGKLEQLSDDFAKSLFIHRTYERAVVDEETGFYTYPYFYFALKERLLGKSKFSVLVFEVNNFDQNTPHALSKWSKEVKSLLPQKATRNDLSAMHTHNMSSHFVSRLDRNQFIVLFNMKTDKDLAVESSLTMDEILSFCEKIENISSTMLSKNTSLYGTIVVKPEKVIDVEGFRKRLEFALQSAKYHENFATIFDTSLKATAS